MCQDEYVAEWENSRIVALSLVSQPSRIIRVGERVSVGGLAGVVYAIRGPKTAVMIGEPDKLIGVQFEAAGPMRWCAVNNVSLVGVQKPTDARGGS